MRHRGTRKPGRGREQRRHAERGRRGRHDRIGTATRAHARQSVGKRHAYRPADPAHEPRLQRDARPVLAQCLEIAHGAARRGGERHQDRLVAARNQLPGSRTRGVIQRAGRHAHQLDRFLVVLQQAPCRGTRPGEKQGGVGHLFGLDLPLRDRAQAFEQHRQRRHAPSVRLVQRREVRQEGLRQGPEPATLSHAPDALELGTGRHGIGVRERRRRAVVDALQRPHLRAHLVDGEPLERSRGIGALGRPGHQLLGLRVSDGRVQHVPLAAHGIHRAERIVALQRAHRVEQRLGLVLPDRAVLDGHGGGLDEQPGRDGAAHERPDHDVVLPGVRGQHADRRQRGDRVGIAACVELHERGGPLQPPGLAHPRVVRQQQREARIPVEFPVALPHARRFLELHPHRLRHGHDPLELHAVVGVDGELHCKDELEVVIAQELRPAGPPAGRALPPQGAERLPVELRGIARRGDGSVLRHRHDRQRGSYHPRKHA